jgi:Streptomycin adenylyltransferase
MWQDQMVDRIKATLVDDAKVRALFLGGSFGKGVADAYSDIDLIAVVAPADQDAFNAGWKERLQSVAPIVFWNELVKGDRIFNAITDQWQRIDLYATDAEGLKRHGRDTLKSVFDKDDLYATLPETTPWSGPNKGFVTYIINEFIRIFGLLPVGVGRGEYLTCIAGIGMLRMLVFDLLTEEVERADKGGMLAWSRRFSAEQLEVLASIPAVVPERQSVITANLACARAFFPRARKMAARAGIEWPQAFEDAMWGYLGRELEIERATVGQ